MFSRQEVGLLTALLTVWVTAGGVTYAFTAWVSGHAWQTWQFVVSALAGLCVAILSGYGIKKIADRAYPQ